MGCSKLENYNLLYVPFVHFRMPIFEVCAVYNFDHYDRKGFAPIRILECGYT
jgi:hypothetical protein